MKNKFVHKLVSIFVFGLFFYQTNTYAAVIDASVSIDAGTIIAIDLSESITEPNMASINVGPTQQAGASTVLNGSIVTYTPPSPTFVGTDSFSFDVLDAVNAVLGSGTVTVNVGLAAKVSTVSNSPSEAVSTVLSDLCLTNVGTPVAAALVDLCNDFTLATAAELEQLAEAVAPKELGGQNQLSTALAAQQVDNIRARLAALRQGFRGLGTSQLSFKSNNDRTISFDDLFEQQARGGAASANNNLGGVGVFGSGTVGGGTHDKSKNEDGYTLRSRGLSFGSDYRLDRNTVAGAAIGLNSSSMVVDQNGGDLTVKGFSVIGYGSFYMNPKAYVESIVAAYSNTFTAARIVEYDISGVPRSSIASSETDNAMLSFSVGAGYEMMHRRGITVNVSGNLDYIKTAFDGYAESGAGGANLTIESRQDEQLTLSANLHVTYVVNQASGVLIPQFDLAMKHELKQDASIIEGSFSNDPNATRFEFSTDTPDANYLKANLGFSYIVPGGTTGFMSYERTLGRSDFVDYSLSIGLRAEF